ncbi:TetR/AcrR family transcriptional regulator [Parvibaculum sp.]|jgi:AcrR family transcriptional regulator|uniref:TetR/AcrR family transcriptional regulator n=1 Tax=Parvibaculum sp. TaxID=2024848 RepID=UPI000C4938B7|nr:TetR/AcrR family transcriptional regulator [Parvibaculum sp.]MAM93052.1 hypothetical protein [Parvibaculum sp.]HCX68734.1 hypothetical protein [Rhodobiaceae bacterium]|tara:strand:+ start:3432 stop:4166 length:735 start_codon:yes stop_codon:yes gene_type:complete
MARKTLNRGPSSRKSTDALAEKSVGPVRRRLSPEERRRQIVVAAKTLFSEEGVDHVSMRKIAREVGITQAAIYQHFENRDAILFAIIEDFFADLLEVLATAVARETQPLLSLRSAMRAYVDYGLAHPEAYRLVFMTPISGLVRAGVGVPRTEEAKLKPSKGTLAFDVLDSAVRKVMECGMVRHDNADLLAEAIWAAGHGLVSLLITHNEFPWTDPDKVIDIQIDLLFRGLLNEDSPMRTKMFPA